MKKVIVIGCPGSGKTTLSKKLHKATGLPLHHLDLIWHKPDGNHVSREEFDLALEKIFSTDRWIIDGNYNRTVEARIKQCDTVILLDVPVEICLKGAEERIGKARNDLPWVEKEFDPEFRQWITDFPKEQLPVLYGLIEEYKIEKDVIILRSREETDEYIESIKHKQ